MIAALAEPGSLRVGSQVLLDQGETHHLRVRRVEAGEEIRLFDGEGATGAGRLGWRGALAEVSVTSVERVLRPPVLRLGVGAGDRERFAWLVEKATELGVTDIVPLEADRTGGVATRLREPQIERLRARAREAVKQCQAAWAPRIHETQTVSSFAEQPVDSLRWLADASGAPPSLPPDATPVSVAIGPEGGFGDRELRLLCGHGFTPVCLSPHLLRFETAALAAAAVITSARPRGRS